MLLHKHKTLIFYQRLMTVRCRRFYLPGEFIAVFVTTVYILVGANANEALVELHNTIRSIQARYLEAFYMVVGDFNHTKLTDTLPSLLQYVTFPTFPTFAVWTEPSPAHTLDFSGRQRPTREKLTWRITPPPSLALSANVLMMSPPPEQSPATRKSLQQINPCKAADLTETSSRDGY